MGVYIYKYMSTVKVEGIRGCSINNNREWEMKGLFGIRRSSEGSRSRE